MKMTPAQENAASSRGGSRLVSAAAGSGKTTVLVERLMRYVDDGADINDFLVITYTRAAAGELRTRIMRAINERIAADPENRHLRRQPEYCLRADIGTIDSICGRFLRESTHLAGLAPDFRVADEERAGAILSRTLEKLLESIYETIEEHPERRSLVDSFGAGRDDSALSALLLRLYQTVQSHPDPAEWLEQQKEALYCSGVEDIGQTVWGRFLLSELAADANFWICRLGEIVRELEVCGNEPFRNNYTPSLLGIIDSLRRISTAAGIGWEAARSSLPLEPCSVGKKRAEKNEFTERVKHLREKCLEQFKAKKEKKNWVSVFSASSEELLRELRSSAPAAEALLDMVVQLDRDYTREKRRLNLVDFSDQEHMVLQLLRNRQNGLADKLSRRYTEILVDEYQDVNACQDALFRMLSDGGKKLFVVGDVKQSIYRFRLADPTIFLRQYAASPDLGEDILSPEPARILLRENFRSRPEVVDSVNHVFENIMSTNLGELEYDENAALKVGAPENFPAGAGGRTELIVLTLPEEDDEEAPSTVRREAEYIAGRIREMVDAGEQVSEKDHIRPAQWGDFAILLRSNKSATPIYARALSDRGIPSVSQQGGGFFSSVEIETLLSMLAVIDNPRQDVPLLAVLTSPLFTFSPDSLALIHSAASGDFYTRLCEHARSDAPCASFLHQLEGYRLLAPLLSIEALLQRISRDTRLVAILSAMPDGEMRRENVRMLLSFARQFESEGSRGIYRFLQWLERLRESGKEPRTGSTEESGAVQIISIHHSKGLEYPVVFLAGTGKKLNAADSRAEVLIHPELGLGARFVDTVRGIRYPTIAWNAVSQRMKSESISEEMRILYVAMTRAKDRLIITGFAGKPEKMLADLSAECEAPVPPLFLRGDSCMLKWLVRTALLPGSPIDLKIHTAEKNTEFTPSLSVEAGTEPELSGEALAGRLTWRYPHAAAEELPSKLTASSLETLFTDEEACALAAAPAGKKRAHHAPVLSGEERPLSGTERGIAVHTVLQFINHQHCTGKEEILREIERLVVEQHLTARQAAAADPESIRCFFASETGRRILHADEVHRELRFSLLVDSSGYYPECPGEEILLQGVVDCCIREGNELTVIDYKTDAVTEGETAARAQSYRGQVKAYAQAMEALFGLPVKETVLYFLRPGIAEKIPLEEVK